MANQSNLERLGELVTEMEGHAGHNWRDEYPGWSSLSIPRKIEVLEEALEQYRD